METYIRLGVKAQSDESQYSYEDLSIILNAYRHLTWAMCDLGTNIKYPEAVNIFLETASVWGERMRPAIERRDKLLGIYNKKLTHNGKGE